MELVHEKLKMKNEMRRNWFQRVLTKTKFENNTITVEERLYADSQKAKFCSKKLILKIKDLATRMAEAGSMRYIECIGHN